ncbi:glycosyl transferase, putative [Babesia ovata]|uniref:Glycosyl transferase, putative n=1 Tax=Babesia ovata TaxID=189622 RepID=A0A2H6KJV4_9APIC|nr:glycosyl transferase, putative [Babesia ovata]GBE63259.1 glycosyl transferase, putative [Babesia ovata]
MSVHVFHEALEAHEEIPVYLAGQLPQLLGHLGGEVFQRVLRGLHVVPPRLLGELRDCIFYLLVYEAFNVFHFLPFYVIGVGEEGVDAILDFFKFFVNMRSFQLAQMPTGVSSCSLNGFAELIKVFSDLGDCVPIELFNVFLDFLEAILIVIICSNLLYHKFHILDHASFFCIFAFLTLQLTPQIVKLLGDLVDALVNLFGLFGQYALLIAKFTNNILQALSIVIIIPTCLVTHPFGHQFTQRLDDVVVQRAHLRFECCFDCFVGYANLFRGAIFILQLPSKLSKLLPNCFDGSFDCSGFVSKRPLLQTVDRQSDCVEAFFSSIQTALVKSIFQFLQVLLDAIIVLTFVIAGLTVLAFIHEPRDGFELVGDFFEGGVDGLFLTGDFICTAETSLVLERLHRVGDIFFG